MIGPFKKKKEVSLLTRAEGWVEKADRLFAEDKKLVSAFLYGNEPTFIELTGTLPGMVFLFSDIDSSVKERLPQIGITTEDGVRPLFLKADDFPQTCTEFPLDLLAMRKGGTHLYGEDLLSGIDLNRDNLKLAVSRELRSVYIHLTSLALTNDREDVNLALISAMNRLLAPFRGILALREAGYSLTWGGVVSAVESSCSLTGFPFTSLISQLEKGERKRLFESYELVLSAVEELLTAVVEM